MQVPFMGEIYSRPRRHSWIGHPNEWADMAIESTGNLAFWTKQDRVGYRRVRERASNFFLCHSRMDTTSMDDITTITSKVRSWAVRLRSL
jgi:hypothetical protein